MNVSSCTGSPGWSRTKGHKTIVVVVVVLLVFDLCFLSTSQEIGWEKHLQNDIFVSSWV